MRTAIAASLSLAAVVFAGTHASGAAGPLPLRPSGDFAVSAVQPLRNFGTQRSLVLTHSPAARAFVRFTLTGRRTRGERFVLWLYPLRGAAEGVQVRHASDTVWRERAATFRTAPKFGTRTVSTGPLRARRWKAVDVTPLVTAGSRVSLALMTTSARGVEIASRESGAHAPRLAVAATAATTAPVVAPEPAPAPAPAVTPPLSAPVISLPPFVAGQPCGRFSQPPVWQHVVWIVMENKAWTSILGAPDAPFVNALAGQCGAASNFFGEAHPSVPNYIAMTSGDTQGITDGGGPDSHPLAVPSIFSQLGADWRSLHESMAANCSRTGTSLYTPTHSPATYYTDQATACLTQSVPLADPIDLSARFTFIVPNMCDNTHNCPVATGDAWLGQMLPKIVDSSQYRAGATAIFLTWDEADGGGANQIATIVVSPSTRPGSNETAVLNHYSMLRATEEMLGLPLLGNAATAPDLRSAFDL